MSEPTKRGRPALSPSGDVPARIDLRMSPTQYDEIYERAQREGISVPALVRRSLRRELADRADDE